MAAKTARREEVGAKKRWRYDSAGQPYGHAAV